MRMIDTPSPFSPLSEWQIFLAEIKTIIASEGSDKDLRAAKKEAKKAIKRLGG